MPVTSSKPVKSINLGYGDFIRFRDLILEYSGLHFSDRKRIDLELGINKALAQSALNWASGPYTLDDYYRHLVQPEGRAELEQLINILTVSETYFFRDEAQFNALANQVLPSLIQQKRASAAAAGLGVRPQLRIWSAGCSSGEEPYSIAMLLKELLPDLANWYILILATDINRQALLRAQQATYSDWSFREAKARAFRARYFNQISTGTSGLKATRYELRSDIRQMVTFAPLNLIADHYPAIENNTVSMDLILCRNVTIYFTEAITRQVVKQFYHALVEGGWLVVGHSEPSLFIYRDFQTQTFPGTLLYQKSGQKMSWPFDWPQETAPTCPTTAPLPVNGHRPVPPPNSRPTRPEPAAAAALPPEKICDQAKLKLENGHPEQAQELLKNLLVTQPDYPPAYTLLARVYANQGHWGDALRYGEQTLKLDNLQADAYRVLAMVHENQGEFQPAIHALKKAIYLDRTMPLDHFSLAMLYQRSGQYDHAYRSLQNVIKILERLEPEAIVPDSGGKMVKHLLDIAQKMVQQG